MGALYLLPYLNLGYDTECADGDVLCLPILTLPSLGQKWLIELYNNTVGITMVTDFSFTTTKTHGGSMIPKYLFIKKALGCHFDV